ncbi:outer membrane receptor protein involved in Fe transport [Neolewinella xylanilytica]|uniref:Outer membrane receptor protein involved in Fe transport n=1 Tax=Neolewinella xylanilytica TaxID=1514080 RepID=A0A2S6IB92_9BACT|nr:outer membrane beta-barrel protein [Neolewinella xylanilytica]PPK88736.1 outer membrane receptor protein involved in Fe transport [Neolewinella xylanilytica]
MIHHYYRLFAILFFTCAAAALAAQETASVAGSLRVADAPAEFANVLLLQATDSAVIKLELADASGTFRFAGLQPGDYFIRTTGIGMPQTDHPAFGLAAGMELQLPVYTLYATATDLATIEVTAKKPFLEQKAGRLVVNVDQSITGQGGSVVDLLKKVPGIVVAGDRIAMAGKSGLTILIDGRPTKYLDINSLLRDMPADNIKSIEVISQPGAAYDAEGNGGVINIVLKKNSLLGTNGQVYIGGGYGERAKYRAGAELSHQSGPLNLTGGVSYNHQEWIEGLDLVRRFDDRTYVQENDGYGVPNSYSLRLGADYDLNDRHRIGVNGQYGFGQSPSFGENLTRITRPESSTPITRFVTYRERQREWNNLNLDGYYRIKLDTSGQELTFDGSVNTFARDTRITLRTEGSDDYPDRLNLEPSDARIFSGRVDYRKPLTASLLLTAGAKASHAELDNELLAKLRINGTLVTDENLSNRYLYDENIAAAYTELGWEAGDWSAKAGLRYEHTRMEGHNVTIDSTNLRSFGQLFPSLSVSAPLKGALGVSLAYSYRIERPSYYDLNPFISYLDPLTYEKGNPFLQPELIHSGQLSVTYEKQPFLNLSYDYTNDIIADVTQQEEASGVAFQTTVNLDRYVRYGGSLFFPLDWIGKSISGYGGAMLYYNDYTSDFLGGNLDQDQWSVTGFMQMDIRLPKDWKFQINGWYQGSGLDGIIRYEPMYGLDAGLQKDFLDDRLNLILSGEGIVQQFFRGEIRYQQQDMDILSTWEAPVFSAKVTYKFGNRFLTKREARDSASQEERGRIGD